MNKFSETFGEDLKIYWDKSEETREVIDKQILDYANSNQETFTRDVVDRIFDEELDPLSVVIDALLPDGDNWSSFYQSVLNKIYERAYDAADEDETDDAMLYLMEFYSVSDIEKPFVNKIAERIYKEIHSDNFAIQNESVSILTDFLENPAVRNRASMLDALHQKLSDSRHKIRFATYKHLKAASMLPQGYRPSILDRLRSFLG